jgi:hypothetical protein
MFVIFALKDDSNPGAMGKSGTGKLFPLALFFLIFGLGACFGYLNPLLSLSFLYTNSNIPGGKPATPSTSCEISALG